MHIKNNPRYDPISNIKFKTRLKLFTQDFAPLIKWKNIFTKMDIKQIKSFANQILKYCDSSDIVISDREI